jgi:hypothetical protein
LPAIYGFPTEEDQNTYFKEIETHPNGMDVAFEGCVVPNPPYDYVHGFVCPECRRIYLEKHHGKDAEPTAGGNDG